jgi:hypothetical protein
VIVPLLSGIALLTAFVLHALRAGDPLIDLRLFRDRTFTTSSVMLVLVAISVFGTFADGLGRIVPFGLVAIVASVLWLTQIGACTSDVATSIDLFVFGAGMGFTMMATFSGAMQPIRGDAVARAGPALNIIQQTGASIGTAVLTVWSRSCSRPLSPAWESAYGPGALGA